MTSITKGRFFRAIEQTILSEREASGKSTDLNEIEQQAQDIFQKSFVIVGQSKFDRARLCGFTVLLERQVRPEQFLQAGMLNDLEMMMVRPSVELFFEGLAKSLGMPPRNAKVYGQRIWRELSGNSLPRSRSVC